MVDPTRVSAALAAPWQPLTPDSPFSSTPTTTTALKTSMLSLPITPPDFGQAPLRVREHESLSTAIHVLSTERDALTHLTQLYLTDLVARNSFSEAISLMSKSISNNGKIIIIGVGKSAKVAAKTAASMNSLSIQATLLHPIDALHGDIGLIRPTDVLMMITYSGSTPELLCLLPHLPLSNPLVVMTAHTNARTCPIIASRPTTEAPSILLPAPIPIDEEDSFGVRAPTTSTTVALALCDALTLAIAQYIHTTPGQSASDVFLSNHPGGAIGSSTSSSAAPTMAQISFKVDAIPLASPSSFMSDTIFVSDILRASISSPRGWVRTSPNHVISPRQIQSLVSAGSSVDISTPLALLPRQMIVEKSDWVSVPATWSIDECRQWIRHMRESEYGHNLLRNGAIFGTVEPSGEVSGVVEIEDLWDFDEESQFMV